jgi:hypothetical protein
VPAAGFFPAQSLAALISFDTHTWSFDLPLIWVVRIVWLRCGASSAAAVFCTLTKGQAMKVLRFDSRPVLTAVESDAVRQIGELEGKLTLAGLMGVLLAAAALWFVWSRAMRVYEASFDLGVLAENSISILFVALVAWVLGTQFLSSWRVWSARLEYLRQEFPRAQNEFERQTQEFEVDHPRPELW